MTAPAATPATVDMVAFDLMDTVLVDPFRLALEAATGLPVEELFARRDRGLYPAFERGDISEADYWLGHAQRGIDVDRQCFHTVRRENTRFIDGMDDLLDQLAGQVVRATASNYPIWIEELAVGILRGRFDHVVASHHLGVRKPDADFYVRLAAATGVDVHRIAFVDDRAINVEAAARVGMPAHLFVGVDPLRQWLRQIGCAVGQ
ncbi:MAG: HAD-IA family hydrolase [Nitriliruptoraceae bacterium]